MRELKYQRTVIGYHGCDESVVRDVLLNGKSLKQSENDYDWLGRGSYFWEHGPSRALDWALQSRQIKSPAVLGAIINLGNCFDLLDTAYTSLLSSSFAIYKHASERTGMHIPENLRAKRGQGTDWPLRRLDCAVINWCIDFLELEEGQHFHTVRCVFTEGAPVFDGSNILAKSHIQIAVRDDSAIVGYFKPSIDNHKQIESI